MLASGVLTLGQAPSSTWCSAACSLYSTYGIRLVVFLLRRQWSTAYNNSEHGKELNAKMGKTPMPAKCFVTVFVSLFQLATMYALQPLALASRFPSFGWAGLALAAGGLILEALADEQKLAAKQVRPNDPIMTGTYSIVRHPNYLGEIIFWGGIAFAAQSALPPSATWAQRLQGCAGPLFMIWVMLGAAKRLDKAAAESKYKDNAEYKAYAAQTPSLFPLPF
jgi:steroid 5-alpha reductase family enzyme